MPNLRHALAPALFALGLGTLHVSCSGGGGSSGGPSPGLVGVVLGYDDAPARGVNVVLDESVSGPRGQVGVDGRFFISPVGLGSHVLRVGDSVTTPSFFIPLTVDGAATFLARPVWLPSLESGISSPVPPVSVAAISVVGSSLDGVRLDFGASSAVTYPAGVPQTVTIVGVAPSRLPFPLPGTLATRAAYAVEPAGARFSPAATLTIPLLEPAASGPFDLYKLDRTGNWVLTSVLALNGTALTAPIDEGAVYAAVPRLATPTVTLTGRVVSGARPIEGYRVECWNEVSEPTGPDGRFTIREVPTVYGAFPLRAAPRRPGVDFAPEATLQLSTTTSTDVGDIVVLARPAITVRPKVLTTNPGDGATNVSVFAQVSVQFSNAVDPQTLDIELRGLRGQAQTKLFLVNAFTAVLVPVQPLDPSDTYSIVVSPNVQDLAGNRIEEDMLLFQFRTQGGAPPPPPSDQRIFGLTPLTGTSNTLFTLFGRNFPGGSSVRVGNTTAFVRLETADTIQFFPPTAEPASDANLAVVNSANTTVASIGPLVLDLRSSIASLSSPVVVRSDPPPSLFVVGNNVANGTVLVDGVAIAAVSSTELFGGQAVIVSLRATLTAQNLGTLFTGPTLVRGANGKPGGTYRFLQVAAR